MPGAPNDDDGQLLPRGVLWLLPLLGLVWVLPLLLLGQALAVSAGHRA